MEDYFEWCGYHWKPSMDGGRIIHPRQPWQWYSSDSITRDSKDNLELFVKKNPKDVKYWDGTIYHPIYEVSTMRSIEEFGYGTFSCQMMMPIGRNLSASFWLSGDGNWPPEIDIEEGWTGDNSNWFRWGERYFPYFKPSWRTTTNVHYRDEQMNKTHVGSRNISIFNQPKDPSENFVRYKCVWNPNEISFFANNVLVRKITGNVCRQLTDNITNPEKGWETNVIFNVWTEDPDKCKIDMIQPMIIKNFIYEPL